MLVRWGANAVNGMPVGVALLVLVALVWLGTAAHAGTHPFFYIGHAFLGGGPMPLFTGVGPRAFASSATTVVRAGVTSYVMGHLLRWS